MKMIETVHRELWKCKIWFLENIRYFKYKKYIKENNRFINVGEGKRCFVIGNGPSLTIDDLNTIHQHGEISFSANKIYKLFDQTSWRPTYFAVCDTKLYMNYKEDIDQLELEKFYPLDLFDKFVKNKQENIHLFSRIPFQFFNNKPRFNPNLFGRFSEGGTITYHLLQLAVAMGFKEIYLLGIDFSFSWGIGPDGKYFENPTVKDHFSADKTKCDTMPNLYYNLQAYKAAKKYADSHGIKIYNATRGGKLEVYERINFDDLFKTDKNMKKETTNTVLGG